MQDHIREDDPYVLAENIAKQTHEKSLRIEFADFFAYRISYELALFSNFI